MSQEVFFAEAAMSARLAAFLCSADLVARLGHLACLPEPVMFAAIAFGNNLASAIARLASSLFSHVSPVQFDCLLWDASRPGARSIPIPRRAKLVLELCFQFAAE